MKNRSELQARDNHSERLLLRAKPMPREVTLKPSPVLTT